MANEPAESERTPAAASPEGDAASAAPSASDSGARAGNPGARSEAAPQGAPEGAPRSPGAGLRLFFQGASLSYVALFRWFRPTSYLASKVAMPLAQMLFFVLLGSFGGAASPAFFVVGNAVQIAAVSGIYGVTMSIGGDRWNGTLPYLFGTPANRLLLFFGRASVHLLDGFIGVAIAFLWGVLLFGLDLSGTDWLALAASIAAVTFATSGLGLLMGCVGLITRNVMFVNNAVYFALLILSGANVPLQRLPGALRSLSSFLPLSAGIAAARRAVSGAPGAWPLIGRELAVGAGYLALGYLVFSLFERAAKDSGSLETV